MTDEMMSDMTAYQKWEHAKLEDIDHDTDALIKMLGDEKMGESYDSGVLAGMLSQKGIDPGILAMLNNNDGFGHGGGLLFLLFLVILMGGNGFGWGNNNRGDMGLDRTIINEGNFNQMMAAVTQSGQAQTAAVQALANNLNTDVAAVTGALAQVDKQIAVNNGDIRSAIQQCCCQVRTGLLEQTNQIQAGFNGLQNQFQMGFNGLQNQASQIAFAQTQQASQNTAAITAAIGDLKTSMVDEFCSLHRRELEQQIQNLRDINATQRDTANTQAILTAIANKDTIGFSGVVDGTNVTGTGSLS